MSPRRCNVFLKFYFLKHSVELLSISVPSIQTIRIGKRNGEYSWVVLLRRGDPRNSKIIKRLPSNRHGQGVVLMGISLKKSKIFVIQGLQIRVHVSLLGGLFRMLRVGASALLEPLTCERKALHDKNRECIHWVHCLESREVAIAVFWSIEPADQRKTSDTCIKLKKKNQYCLAKFKCELSRFVL